MPPADLELDTTWTSVPENFSVLTNVAETLRYSTLLRGCSLMNWSWVKMVIFTDFGSVLAIPINTGRWWQIKNTLSGIQQVNVVRRKLSAQWTYTKILFIHSYPFKVLSKCHNPLYGLELELRINTNNLNITVNFPNNLTKFPLSAVIISRMVANTHWKSILKIWSKLFKIVFFWPHY